MEIHLQGYTAAQSYWDLVSADELPSMMMCARHAEVHSESVSEGRNKRMSLVSVA